jgi:hypothetical protein
VAERRLDRPDPGKLTLHSSLSESGVELTWDSDGRPALLQASWDGGKTWQTLAVDVTTGRLSAGAEWFHATTMMFRVLIADQASYDPDKVLQIELDFSR